ncbi:hypothetical protein GCM10007877_03170 [Marinibactrum halimedae]|uniref:DUF2188 domain-containing protein n=1 Tax=Marinibactrum halimedae TaxID=1444977 RepID=A0AA37WK11_9GAMM|nr:hypothetical protein GCM10007877_03170 [Marinibactrum halimedae]
MIYRVESVENGWVVVDENSNPVSEVFETRQEAEEYKASLTPAPRSSPGMSM